MPPKSVPKEQAQRLAKLGCVVGFIAETENQRDKDGEIKENRKAEPLQKKTVVRANLYVAGTDGKSPPGAIPWLSAVGADRVDALDKALALAEKSEPPARSLTHAQLIAQNATLRAELAAANKAAEKERKDIEQTAASPATV